MTDCGGTGGGLRSADGRAVKALNQSYSRTKKKNYKSKQVMTCTHPSNTIYADADGTIATSTELSSRAAIRIRLTKPVDGRSATEWNGVLSTMKHGLDESGERLALQHE